MFIQQIQYSKTRLDLQSKCLYNSLSEQRSIETKLRCTGEVSSNSFTRELDTVVHDCSQPSKYLMQVETNQWKIAPKDETALEKKWILS